MKKKKIVNVLSMVVLLSVILVMSFSFAGCSVVKTLEDDLSSGVDKIKDIVNPGDELLPTDENGTVLDYGVVHESPKAINFASLTPSNTEDTSQDYSKFLLVHFDPIDATNKNIDVSLEWTTPDSTFATGKDVRDYVDVVVGSEYPVDYSDDDKAGAVPLIVYCYAPFGEDTINMTVTSEIGGFTADCLVSWVGVLSFFDVDFDAPTGDYHGTDCQLVSAFSTTFFDINAGNFYENIEIVDSDFSVEYSYMIYDGTLRSWGDDVYIYVKDGSTDANRVFSYTGESSMIELNPLKNNFINSITVVAGQLKIVTNGSIDNYCESDSHQIGNIWNYTNKFYDFCLVPVCRVKITHTPTGLVDYLGFNVFNGVVGITLSEDNLDF